MADFTNVFKKDAQNNVYAVGGSLYLNTSASVLVKTGEGTFHGVIVHSHTSGTLRVSDATTSVSPFIMQTYTLPTGSSVISLPVGANFTTGLYLNIPSGTANVTVLYN